MYDSNTDYKLQLNNVCVCSNVCVYRELLLKTFKVVYTSRSQIVLCEALNSVGKDPTELN